MSPRDPRLLLTIIASTQGDDLLSIRVDPANLRDAGAFRRALAAAGFKAGDRVVLTLADETLPPNGAGADWS